jgi:hypothetical protein
MSDIDAALLLLLVFATAAFGTLITTARCSHFHRLVVLLL